MIAMTLLVVLALALAGCGGGGGSKSNDEGGNNGGGNNGNGFDFSAYLGTWKSQGVTPAVEIRIESQIGASYFFTGKVTCGNFNSGFLNITETDNSILRDKYILANEATIEGTTITNIHVRAREEYDDALLGTLANELSLDGFLADASTLRVVWLKISRQESDFLYEFDSEGDDYLTFKKQ
mgnify:CR=1 FL=1